MKVVACAAALVLAAGCRPAVDRAETYVLTTCLVCKQPLEARGGPIIFDDQGREIKVCSEECRRIFAADPHPYISALLEQKYL